MFEFDYNNWLESKNKIKFFEELDVSVKKGIYDTEQKLSEHEEIDLVKIDKNVYEDDKLEMNMNFILISLNILKK